VQSDFTARRTECSSNCFSSDKADEFYTVSHDRIFFDVMGALQFMIQAGFV